MNYFRKIWHGLKLSTDTQLINYTDCVSTKCSKSRQKVSGKKLMKISEIIGLLWAAVHLTKFFVFIRRARYCVAHFWKSSWSWRDFFESSPKSERCHMYQQIWCFTNWKNLLYYICRKSAFWELSFKTGVKLPKPWYGEKCTKIWKAGSNDWTRAKSLQSFPPIPE